MYHVISIHAPHEGERLCARRCLKCTTRFQSTLPTRGSDKLNDESHTASNISIHAPHEGERPAGVYDENCEALFQSTLPTRGSDVLDDAAGAIAWIFQSTLPTRGSDRRCWPHQSLISHFNPRSPRGGATGRLDRPLIMKGISIHAPHEGERPVGMLRQLFYQRVFQSTLPTRGSDGGAGGGGGRKAHFNPRSPRGGATGWDCLRRWKRVDFNPRSPRGGATYARTSSAVGFTISIHAPHEGERQKQRLEAELQELFQSTLPTRGSDGGKVHLYAAFPRIY